MNNKQCSADFVSEVSRLWVEEMASQLHEAGRLPEGGWPCTLSDARMRLSNQMAKPVRAIPQADYNVLVKEVYASARNMWLAMAKHPRPREVV